MKLKKLVNFIFELNQLKKSKHIGIKRVGVTNPDSIAEHVCRASQIAYFLAVMEEYPNPDEVATTVLFHDNAEARIGDQDNVAAKYFSIKKAEQKAFKDQIETLEDKKLDKLENNFQEFNHKQTHKGKIAKDADYLELAFQAQEYLQLGYKGSKRWIENMEKALHTKSGKKVLTQMKKTDFNEWHLVLDYLNSQSTP